MTVKISTSGVLNTATTIVALIERMSTVTAALPEVVGLIEAAISTFSAEGKQQVVQAYQQKMAGSDAAHKETQDVLKERASSGEATDVSDTDGSPKGGAQ